MNEDQNPYENNLEKLLQKLIHTYLFMESELKKQIPQSENTKQILETLNKDYDNLMFNHLYSHENKWLYNSLKEVNKVRWNMDQVFSDLLDTMLTEDEEEEKFKNATDKNLSFYNENGKWYIDLPYYLNNISGRKENLIVGNGVDEFLNIISKNSASVQVFVSTSRYDGFEARLSLIKRDINQIDYPKFENGAYYKLDVFNGFEKNQIMWLSDIFKYVFGGHFPNKIWIKIV
jgi:hypothetical protein